MKIFILKLMALSIFYTFIFNQYCGAYDNEHTHKFINIEAVEKSNTDAVLKGALGFVKGKNEKLAGKEIWEWIRDGGYEEDEPEWRCLRHFHDPIKSFDDAGLLSQYTSMIYWAQTSEPNNSYELYNEYSWILARKYYHQALLTGSEEKIAKTFRAIGQLMHLVSDAAVPAHVRNDPHIPYINDADPYEKWVECNKKIIKTIEYADFYIDDSIFDMAVSDPLAPSPISALWDHDEYQPDGSNLPDGSNTTIGLAEYTNANFWTEDTFDDYPHPRLEDTNYDENVWLNPEPVDAEDGEVDHRIYFSKETGDPVTHFMAAGYWYYRLSMWNKPEVRYAFVLDENCFQDYAEKLIPRAIGYSAQLLNYFFRGTIAISPPDAYIYSVIDGSTNQSFKTIKARLHNTTPDEEMLDGTLVAVARYKRRTDYVHDLSANEPPVAESMEASYSYSVSAPIEIASLGSDPATAAQFAFDFSANPIPVGITDLFLQVVYQGTLGNETDTAVAVGATDLSEPNHIAAWNLTDRFYLQGNLLTADDIRADAQLLGYLENTCPHLVAYLDPFPMDTRIGFSASSSITPNSIVAYASLQPGRYGRIIVLSDQPYFVMHVKRSSASPSFNQTSRLTIAAVTNQEEDAGFTNTAVRDIENSIIPLLDIL